MARKRAAPQVVIVAAPHSGADALGRALGLAAAAALPPRRSRFIYLYRDPREAIASAVASGEPVQAAFSQWQQTTRHILDGIASSAGHAWTATTYAALTNGDTAELTRLADFAGVTAQTLEAQAASNWREHVLDIMPRMSAIADINAKAKLICAASVESSSQLHHPTT